MNIEVSCVNTNELRKSLKAMSRGKAGGADSLSIYLTKGAGDFVLKKLVIFSKKCW